MKALLVERDKLKHNLRIINNIISKKDNKRKRIKIIAVVKGNGYGLGLVQYSKFLIDNGINMLAVATVEEAIELRNGGIKTDILMMSSTAVKEDIENLIENEIILTIGSKEAGDAVEEIAKKQGKKVRVHIKIDTGFGRYGFIYTEKEKMIEAIKRWKNIKIEGTFSHLSLAFFGNGKEAQTQFNRFMQCIETLNASKIETGILHICNSSAFLRFENMHLDAVRIGSALLGRLSIPNTWGFKRVGYLKSNVAEIKILPKGYNIGYSNAFVTKKETKVAIIPCGYADGFNVIVDKDMFRKRDKLRYIIRDIKNAFKKQQIKVTINGEKCLVLGRLGMFHVTVDITNKNVEIGDEAIFEVSPMLVDSKITREYI